MKKKDEEGKRQNEHVKGESVQDKQESKPGMEHVHVDADDWFGKQKVKNVICIIWTCSKRDHAFHMKPQLSCVFCHCILC